MGKESTDLLGWLKGREKWQQEAVRLIAEKGSLENIDHSEVRARLENLHGLNDNKYEERELTDKHLTFADNKSKKTIINSIGPVKNLDRLAEAQKPLEFLPDGITIIYGNNGSGKSGYSRITKKLCRSLDAVDLRGNVFDKDAKSPEVSLSYQIEGNNPVPVVYKNGDKQPSELNRISVFDSKCAGLYVDDNRDIEFLPYELSLLENLSIVCTNFTVQFESEEKAINLDIRTLLPQGYNSDGTIDNIIKKITTQTALKDLPTEKELKDLAIWNEELDAKLKALDEEVKNDPNLLASVRKQCYETLEALKLDIAEIESLISDAAIHALVEKKEDAARKRNLASSSAKDLFKDEPINNLDSESWRLMLKYAREFATNTFPDCEHPKIANGDKCVLCHQELTPDAKERMARFDTFLNTKISQEADSAKQTFEEKAKGTLTLKIKSKDEITTLTSNLSKIDKEKEGLATKIINFYTTAKARHEKISTAIKTNTYNGNYGSLEVVENSVIDTNIQQLKSDEQKYISLSKEKGKQDAIKAELNELKDRKKLSTEVATFIERLKKITKLKKLQLCKASCATRDISTKLSEIRNAIYTPSLKKTFGEEIEALDLMHLPLKIAGKSDKGKNKVEVGVAALQPIKRNSEILSEGEQRALALACFFTEINEVGTGHGIIIDDPVSSMDHTRIELVAKRIVRAAQEGRQVIIFTHNIFFYFTLLQEASDSGISIKEEFISRDSNNSFGIINAAKRPWIFKSVGQRISEITQDISELEKIYDNEDEKHRPDVRLVYNKIRETWEKLIEEILFNNITHRFNPDIQTTRIDGACIEEDDRKAVNDGMTRCSYFTGHDRPAGSTPNLPKIDVIKTDLRKLIEYVAKIDKRRKELDKASKEIAEPLLFKARSK